MPTDTPELLPCPFCGEQPIREVDGEGSEIFRHTKVGNCFLRAAAISPRVGHVEQWNRRDVAPKFDVIQHVTYAGGFVRPVVWTTPNEYLARDAFEKFTADYPSAYFELLRVTHREECLEHTGKAVKP